MFNFGPKIAYDPNGDSLTYTIHADTDLADSTNCVWSVANEEYILTVTPAVGDNGTKKCVIQIDDGIEQVKLDVGFKVSVIPTSSGDVTINAHASDGGAAFVY